jgi:asparagine synthase (glutamine-hydrolysing)
MCGIAGIIGLDPSKSRPVMDGMTAAIRHRGPDAEGVFAGDGIMLGHCRLSIIDLSKGANQPFSDNSDRYTIVFNGEIYNYKEVKDTIDYPWKTSSDTEVILAAYIRWGKDCLQYLNGMFAFAIWDQQDKILFMARDRMGIKPFYYYHDQGLFIFSSEIRSILQTGLVNKKINLDALYQYLAQAFVKTPATMIENIYQLLPGTYAIFKDGQMTVEAYWKIDEQKAAAPLNHEEITRKVRALFEDSIKNRMVSDVQVGAFLSGGIDSSAVVATMSKYTDQPVETFSIVFNDKEFDESQYSRLIAEKYKTKHTEFVLEPKELIEQLPAFISHLDTPSADGINTFIVSKLVAGTGIKVVLTGTGGDELFAGYPNFSRWKQYATYGKVLNNPLTRVAARTAGAFVNKRSLAKINDLYNREGGDLDAFYESSRAVFMKDELDKLFDRPVQQQVNKWVDLDGPSVSGFPLLSRYSIAELSNYTMDVLLKDTDQMSMAWALEVREPFFDYHLVEFLLSVPDADKQDGKTPKKLLVEAMGDLLPEEIVYRPKKGFTFPWDIWMRNDLKAYCESSVLSLEARSLFRTGAISDLWKRFLSKDPGVIWMQVWLLVILEKWMTENGIGE